MNRASKTALVLAAFAAAGCAMIPRSTPDNERATVLFYDARGEQVASATLRQDGDDVELDVTVTALPAGTHGIHFHDVGRCDAPDFTTAGGHFNPAARAHGLDNPAGAHNGDLPNLVVDATGKGHWTAQTSRVSLAAGAGNVFDANGTALVIHAAADDQKSDPSGNSGARIACGVVGRQ